MAIVNATNTNAGERCALCGAETSEIFSTRDYRRPSDETLYTVLWCDYCALGTLAGDFSPDDVRSFFDVPYYTHGPDQAFGKFRSQYKQSLLDRLIVHLAWRVDRGKDLTPDELGPAGSRTLCDLGCGDGKNLEKFSKVGFQVVGIEPDPVARSRAKQVAEVFDGTVERLPSEVSCRRFDVVLLSHVLDVCNDLTKSLENIRSIVSETGTVVIEVPNFAATGFQVYAAEWPWTDIPRHLTLFTERSLTQILKVGGFSVKKVQYVGYTRQFLPAWRDTQTLIHQVLGKNGPRVAPLYWWLVLTAFSSDAKRYDSVRVLASPT